MTETLIAKPADTYELFTEARMAYDGHLLQHPGEVNDAWIACFEVIRSYFAPQASEIPSQTLIEETLFEGVEEPRKTWCKQRMVSAWAWVRAYGGDTLEKQLEAAMRRMVGVESLLNERPSEIRVNCREASDECKSAIGAFLLSLQAEGYKECPINIIAAFQRGFESAIPKREAVNERVAHAERVMDDLYHALDNSIYACYDGAVPDGMLADQTLTYREYQRVHGVRRKSDSIEVREGEK